MGLVSDWFGAARTLSALVLASVTLLLAVAVLVAGGGLGGISSLGQLSGGPALPQPGLGTAGDEGSASLADAEIVGAGVGEPDTAGPGSLGDGAPGALAATGPGGQSLSPAAGPPAASPEGPGPQQAPTGTAPGEPAPGARNPTAPGEPPAAETPGSGPVRTLLEKTGEGVQEITNGILKPQPGQPRP